MSLGPLHTRSVGEGEAVIWLHGYTMDSSTWSELWSLLPGWRHVGVDLAGHGGSAALEPGTTLPQLAAGVAEIVQRHSARRLVALSFGTMVALQLAIDHPTLIQRLVLAAPALGDGETEPGADHRYLELMRLYESGASAAELADTWMRSPPDIFRGTETHPLLRFTLRRLILRHRWTELGDGAMRLLTDHPQTDREIAGIRARLQVVVGGQDMPVTRAVAERLRMTVPGARLDVMTGAGHLCLLEEPATAAALIQGQLAAGADQAN
jgi:3-oxoadipate enol-lactonase